MDASSILGNTRRWTMLAAAIGTGGAIGLLSGNFVIGSDMAAFVDTRPPASFGSASPDAATPEPPLAIVPAGVGAFPHDEMPYAPAEAAYRDECGSSDCTNEFDRSLPDAPVEDRSVSDDLGQGDAAPINLLPTTMQTAAAEPESMATPVAAAPVAVAVPRTAPPTIILAAPVIGPVKAMPAYQ